MTASTPCRSRSPCHSSTPSPTRSAASRASTSSQEPGKRTTPTFIPTRAPSGSRTPRSAGWPAASRTSPLGPWGRRRRARSAAPRGRWPRRRSPARAARAPPPCPGDRGSRTSAAPAPAPSRRPLQPGRERLVAQPLVGLDVLRARLLHHLVGEGGGRRGLVPAVARRPVPYVLLVEGALAAAGPVLVGRPEPGRVGSHRLVAERQLAGGVEAELELGVGQDDPPGARVLSAE